MVTADPRAVDATTPRWRVHPTTRRWILVLHIAASVALLGEVWGLVALNLYATLTPDVALARSAYRLMEVLVFAGGIPLSMGALLSGIVLGLVSPWGVFRHWWVITKLLLLIGVVLVGMLLFQPLGMAAAIEDGSQTAAMQWQQVGVVATQLAMLLTATWLSVFRPRRRTPRVRWSRGTAGR